MKIFLIILGAAIVCFGIYELIMAGIRATEEDCRHADDNSY